MALERRGNRLYFYRKERRGKRVISIYSGGGDLAQCFYVLDQQRKEEVRIEEENKKRSFDKEKQSFGEIDSLIDSFCHEAKAFEDALFLINDYRVHERQWRKKRNDNKAESEEA